MPEKPETDAITAHYETTLCSLKLLCERIDDPALREKCYSNGQVALANIYMSALDGCEISRQGLRQVAEQAARQCLAAGLLAPGPAPAPRVQ